MTSASWSVLAAASGASLLVAGLGKYGSRHRFEKSLRLNPLTSSSAGFLVGVVPPVEIMVGVLLVVGRPVRLGAVLGAMLFAAFVCFHLASHGEDCGCGPVAPRRRRMRLAVTASAAVGLSALAWADPSVDARSRLVVLSSIVIAWLTIANIREHQRRRRDMAAWAAHHERFFEVPT